jgi:hypothetical protein
MRIRFINDAAILFVPIETRLRAGHQLGRHNAGAPGANNRHGAEN